MPYVSSEGESGKKSYIQVNKAVKTETENIHQHKCLKVRHLTAIWQTVKPMTFYCD